MANMNVCKNCATHFCTSSRRFRDINNLNVVRTKSRSRSWNTNFAMLSFDDKYLQKKSTRALFAPAPTVSEKLTFTISDLQNVGQSHGVTFSQGRHSMANIHVPLTCTPALIVSHRVTFQIVYLQQVGQDHKGISSQWYQWKISLSTKVALCTVAIAPIMVITFQIFYLQNVGQGHVVHFSQFSLNGKYRNL